MIIKQAEVDEYTPAIIFDDKWNKHIVIVDKGEDSILVEVSREPSDTN